MSTPAARAPGPRSGGHWLGEVRRGTIDLARDLLGGENPQYWDAFGKLGFQVDERQNLRLNALHSADRLDFVEVDGEDSRKVATDYVNSYLWLTHLGILSPRLYVESAASASWVERDRFGLESEEINDFAVSDERNSRIFGVRQAWGLQAGSNSSLSFGGALRGFDTRYNYSRLHGPLPPPARILPIGAVGLDRFHDTSNDHDASLFASDRQRFGESLDLELGLRWDRYSQTGESHLSPRMSLAWRAAESTVIRLAWGRYLQSQRPYELQVEDGDTEFHPVEQSEQRILGLERRFTELFGGHGLTVRAEFYERRVSHPRTRFENLFEPFSTFPEAEPDRVRIDASRSRARGLELFARSRLGERFGWWINYALARTEDLVDDTWVPRSFDQRHALNLDLAFQLGAHWSMNLAWVYHSGWPTTPIGLRPVEGEGGEEILVAELGALNSARLTAYHRLDLRASRQWRPGSTVLTLFVDVQNLYDRANLAGYDITLDEEGQSLVILEEEWAGIVPSAGVRLEF